MTVCGGLWGSLGSTVRAQGTRAQPGSSHPSPLAQVAPDFIRQGGQQALEQHQSSPVLQERARALLDMARQPPGASPAGPGHSTVSAFP